jgi:hypothetical protein
MARDDLTKSKRGDATAGPAAGVPADHSADAKLLHANQLYETVKTLTQTTGALDQRTARLIVETSDDAIREFGNTNQDKKIDLRNWKAEAEALLPPLTIKELKDRAEAQILAKGFPTRKLPRKILLYLIGAVLLIIAVAAIYKEFPKSGTKPPDEGKAAGEKKIADSVTINLPAGMTLRRAIKFLAQLDNLTADFQANCHDDLLSTEIEGGPLTAANTEELIKLLRLRLKHPRQPASYKVEKKPEKGTYEISCP